MANKYEIEGLDEILAEFEELAKVKNLEKTLGKACALVERTAKQKAPKGNGELRRSIKSRIEGENGIVFTPLEYAPYVEYGTGLGAYEEHGSGNGRLDVPWSYQDEKGEWHTTFGMSPHPFMRPALNENREKILEILKGGIIND